MGAAAPKPPLAIPPNSKLWGFLAFSRETAWFILLMVTNQRRGEMHATVFSKD